MSVEQLLHDRPVDVAVTVHPRWRKPTAAQASGQRGLPQSLLRECDESRAHRLRQHQTAPGELVQRPIHAQLDGPAQIQAQNVLDIEIRQQSLESR